MLLPLGLPAQSTSAGYIYKGAFLTLWPFHSWHDPKGGYFIPQSFLAGYYYVNGPPLSYASQPDLYPISQLLMPVELRTQLMLLS